MAKIDAPAPLQTFNGTLEAGIRAVAVLVAAWPAAYDIQRLTAYDYLLVHTEQLGGPQNLHPPSIISAPVSQVRRSVVQNALYLMITRQLVERTIESNGIKYRAGDSGTFFLESLASEYILELKARADWIVHHLASYDDTEFDALMQTFFDKWVVEFQAAERSLGHDL